uniref:Uncharacterized protein n=1 Tax=Oryza sativa subsp. japonica TaxID=39947 RepID=Q5VPV2_ORYSJ|nr:hypothetical protein [Oryza sativa Japonica Group]
MAAENRPPSPVTARRRPLWSVGPAPAVPVPGHRSRQPPDRLGPIWAVHPVDGWWTALVIPVHGGPSPLEPLTPGTHLSAPAPLADVSGSPFPSVFPRFACQRVESVVSEVRGREEKSSEDQSEEERQVTHSP